MTSKLDKIIHLPYYYVPPCPRCSSKKTGRYIKSHNDVEDTWAYITSLKHGELTVELEELNEENVFCMDCGFAWPDIVSLNFFSLERIKQEKLDRGTIELLNYEKKVMKEERKEYSRKKNNGGLLNSFKKFVGQI